MARARRRRQRPVRSVLVVGQLPPPLHGQALALQALVESRPVGLRLRSLRMAFSRDAAEVGRFGPYKLVHGLGLVVRAVRALRVEPALLYYPPAPPRWLPVLRDLVFLSCVRPFAAGTVFHFHASGLGDWLAERPWLAGWARRAYGDALLAIHVGPSVPDDGGRLGARRVVTIPGGVADPLVTARSRDPGVLSLLYVGLHSTGKGIHRALRVVALLRGRGVPVRLRTVGAFASPAERERARATVRRESLAELVHFEGPLEGDAKWRAFAESDALLFPTTHHAESQGLVAVEAMAMGLPVVASRWRGPRDVVVDGETGALCEADDVESMADALQALFDDPALARRLGAAGRARYEKHYRLETHLAAVHSALRAALAAASGEDGLSEP